MTFLARKEDAPGFRKYTLPGHRVGGAGRAGLPQTNQPKPILRYQKRQSKRYPGAKPCADKSPVGTRKGRSEVGESFGLRFMIQDSWFMVNGSGFGLRIEGLGEE